MPPTRCIEGGRRLLAGIFGRCAVRCTNFEGLSGSLALKGSSFEEEEAFKSSSAVEAIEEEALWLVSPELWWWWWADFPLAPNPLALTVTEEEEV